MLIHYEGDTQALEDDAKAIVSLLWHCYPYHPWSVTCKRGLIFIRHLDFTRTWGMALRVSELDHDAAVMKKKIITLAGEWLERAALKRGAYDSDQESYRVEGIPEKHQPHQPLPDTMTVTVNAAPYQPPRETPRPQVAKALNGD